MLRTGGKSTRLGLPVWLVAAAVFTTLAVTSAGYGYHRDELYFLAAGRRLAWGYPDQPPLTPLLARLGDALAPGEVWALRLPAVVLATATVLLVALIAAEMGADRRARLLAAVFAAASGITLQLGHILVTNTTDLFFAAVIGWLVARLIRTGDRRLLLAIGVAAGVGLENKTLLALPVLALLGAILVVGPREVVRGWWLVAGIAAAALLWAPNLIWQLQHGFPQLGMMGPISAKERLGGRWGLLPFQFALFGPVLAPVFVAGLVRLLRTPSARPFRAFGVAYLVMFVLLLAGGGNALYLAGGFPALLAAGAIATGGWLDRARSRLRSALVSAMVVLAVLSGALLGLPLIPVDSLRDSPTLAMYREPGETVGWPRLAETVAGAYRALGDQDRARAVVIATNYGEAGALDRYGPALGLPPVFSGHNGFFEWGPPPEDNDLAVVVGGDPGVPLTWMAACRDVRQLAVLDNGYGLANDEQGRPVWLCRGLTAPWSKVWPATRILG
ncbi:ArnT family glycosyltransferase [Amycolatopsis sp. CA-230715]|uniref:ArnT family glycosyltransferase n=1 Tax=Amycolatopsis sp. CA-230715 TaxID=2745196 RepID=UPI001C03910C|nr:glycosyltransferase family 39 protein [Amycolatopsis sp. CA-230715]